MGSVAGGGDYLEGAPVTLTATAEEGFEFVSWMLAGKVVSTSATYAFTPTGPGNYTAIFRAVSTWTVSFLTHTGFAMYVVQVADGGKVSDPGDLVRNGFSFDGWDWNFDDEIFGNTVIQSLWTKDDVNVSVVVTAGSASDENPELYTFITLTADADNSGVVFAYWVINGQVYSYDRVCRYCVTSDIIAEAFFEETPEPAAVLVAITGYSIVANGAKWNVSFTANVAVPEGCTIVERGVISSYYKVGDSSYPLYDRNDSNFRLTSEKINRCVVGGLESPQYMGTFIGVTGGWQYCARAYVTYFDGNEYITAYSDIVIVDVGM